MGEGYPVVSGVALLRQERKAFIRYCEDNLNTKT
jgi:hypothetical protein